jgi:hypothetical protein
MLKNPAEVGSRMEASVATRTTFYEDLLDIKAYIGSDKKWPSLKLVFDNLRCYPILAVFLFAMAGLSRSPAVLPNVIFWCLLPVMLLLTVATIWQTTVMISVLFMGIVTTFTGMPEEGTKVEVDLNNLRWFQLLIAIVLFVIVTMAFLSSMMLLQEIGNFLRRTTT